MGTNFSKIFLASSLNSLFSGQRARRPRPQVKPTPTPSLINNIPLDPILPLAPSPLPPTPTPIQITPAPTPIRITPQATPIRITPAPTSRQPRPQEIQPLPQEIQPRQQEIEPRITNFDSFEEPKNLPRKFEVIKPTQKKQQVNSKKFGRQRVKVLDR